MIVCIPVIAANNKGEAAAFCGEFVHPRMVRNPHYDFVTANCQLLAKIVEKDLAASTGTRAAADQKNPHNDPTKLPWDCPVTRLCLRQVKLAEASLLRAHYRQPHVESTQSHSNRTLAEADLFALEHWAVSTTQLRASIYRKKIALERNDDQQSASPIKPTK